MINALSYQVQEEIIEILLIATHRTQTRLTVGHAGRVRTPDSRLPIPHSRLPTPGIY
ncbi:MAG: hypothetical protein F6J98_05465 [Moorea sp. SIO4G2]|nr:hypothetical protein [Moorena sp. SIO4G2]